jgi:hypothetical protein
MMTDEERRRMIGARARSVGKVMSYSTPDATNLNDIEITPETELTQFKTCKIRRKRIEVLAEAGRRILETHPNLPFDLLQKTLVQMAQDLWEVQPRWAKDYARRVMPRLEKMRSSSSSFRPGLNKQGEDYARARDYVELLRQNPTHDRQEES